jgi:membrane-bound lytic murein transglycosylase D
MRRVIAALLFALLVPAVAAAAPKDFPRPPEIEPAVRFWTKIYSQVPTSGGLLHDRDDLSIVYEQLSFPEGATRRERSREVRDRRQHYREVLLEIVRSDRDHLSPDAERVLSLWPEGVSDTRLERAAYNIRFQLGQADKFRAGLVRSGAWEPHIRRTLKEMGLPEELAALPHVESSFNPNAWSRVGAAGLWQFTRPTGRRYMRIDHVVDERMDPFKSTIAAARLLEHNYSVTGSWALALTAYNHGLAGIRRAVRQVGTKNIAEIRERYRSRTWGFASRNFYPAFLAAVEVDFHAHTYFGIVDRHDPIQSETIELPFYADPRALAEAFDVSIARLRELNGALREPVWDGNKRVPRGYELRVPAAPERPPARELLARVDPTERYYAQVPDRFHRVRRGEALSTIADRYGVSTHELVALNNLRSRHFIRAGQTLRLPVPGEAGATAGTGASNGVYEVRRGDTLSGIAQRVGMSVGSLVAANGLDDQHRIYPGQKLRVDGQPVAADPAVASSEEAGAADTPAEETVVALAQTAADAASETATDAAVQVPNQAAGGDQRSTPARETAERTTGVAPQDRDRARPAHPAGPGSQETDGDVQLARATAAESEGTAAASGESDAGGTGASPASSPQPAQDLTADPSDYEVGAGGTIEVQAAETLGHYAEWLDLRASQLRRVNDMRYGTPVVVGKRLELDFSRVTPDTFEQRRLAYHEELQGRFFEQFRIAGTEQQIVQPGDSLWTLARRSDNVPVWLLRQYNPDLDFSDLHPGMPVTLPVIERQPQARGDDGTQHAEQEQENGAAGA